MPLTQMEVNIKKVAYALGALQGITYAVLAIVCIIIYNQPTRTFTKNSSGTPVVLTLIFIYPLSYMNIVEASMYYTVLGPVSLKPDFDQSLVPRVFDGFAWTHLILHLLLCGVSLEAMRRDRAVYTRYPQLWSYIVWMVCLWDFITMVILAADYEKCLRFASNSFLNYELIAMQQMCANGILPILVIAAKGFILWVINLVLGIVLHSMGMKLKLKPQSTQIFSAVVYSYPQETAVPQPAFQPSHAMTSTNFQRQKSGSQMPGSSVQYYTPTNLYQTQGQVYQPNMIPSSAQNLRKEQFEYPSHISDRDYDKGVLNSNERRH